MKLFLDDIRIPTDASRLVPTKSFSLYWEDDWVVVRNYDEFVEYIKDNGVPEFVSFDHDLGDISYEIPANEILKMSDDDMLKNFGVIEKTGLDCAKFLVEYCADENVSLPNYLVHSANPAGKENIEKFLENAKKHLNI